MMSSFMPAFLMTLTHCRASKSVGLNAEGLSVPDKVACACLCLCDPSPPGLAGIRPHLDLLGERAVSIVVAQLKTTQRGVPECASSIYVQSLWQDGLSAPARR